MRNIKVLPVIVGLLASPIAYGWGIHQDSYQFQAKTKNISALERRNADLTVKVSDPSGKPLTGVDVLVGTKVGEPFAANQAYTGSDGVARFTNPAIPGNALTITASFAGYGTFSLANNTENSVEIVLAPNPREDDHAFLEGRVNGFPPGYNRRTLEMGFFVPAFKPESLMNFDPQQIVSSYQVEIDVYGKRMVPGNIVLPPQDKSYGIIPIHLEKPGFIMPLPMGLNSHMTASAGAVPIGAAVDAIRAKDFLGVINLASFTHIAWTQRMTVGGNERFDMNLSQPLAQQALTTQLGGVEPKLDAISVSMLDPEGDGGDFISMDIKSLKSENIKNGTGMLKLGILSQRKATDRFYVFTGLFDRNQLLPKGSPRAVDMPSRSIVGAVEPVNATNLTARFQSFLNVIQSQGVGSGNREFRFTSPANSRAGLVPDFVFVNVVSEKKNAATMGTTRTLLWSTVIRGNAERVVLPDLGRPVLPTPDTGKEERFVWEVIAFKARGNAANGAELDVQSALRNVQHVSTLVQKF